MLYKFANTQSCDKIACEVLDHHELDVGLEENINSNMTL